MDISEGDTERVPSMDSAVKYDLSFDDTIKTGAIILPGFSTADPVENAMLFSEKQIESTIHRVANIGVGLAWYHNASQFEAAILSSNAVSVLLIHLSVPNTRSIQDIVHEAVNESLFMYYRKSGVPLDKPRGNPEVRFVKKQHKVP